jgi:hypothetical protein
VAVCRRLAIRGKAVDMEGMDDYAGNRHRRLQVIR